MKRAILSIPPPRYQYQNKRSKTHLIILAQIIVLIGCQLCLFNKLMRAQSFPAGAVFPIANSPANERNLSFNRANSYNWASVLELWLVYDVEFSPTNTEIFIQGRTWQDKKWSEPLQLTSNDYLDQFPAVAVLKNNVLVVWQTNQNGHLDLAYAIRDSNGWSPATLLTDDIEIDQKPVLQTINWHYSSMLRWDYIALVWQRQGKLCWRLYTENGWRPMQFLTSDSTEIGQVRMFGGADELVFVWDSQQNGNWDIWASYAPIPQLEWTPPKQITSDPHDNQNPCLFPNFNGSGVGIIWQSDAQGNYDLYGSHWYFGFGRDSLTEIAPLETNEANSIKPYACVILAG